MAFAVSRRLALALSILLCAAWGASGARADGLLVTRDGQTEPSREVTLVDHRVAASIRDGVADVTVEQTFHSRASVELEGIYLFPLPQGATVRRFAMTMGGTMVQGEVVEAQAARRVYEDIVRARRDPGLLQYVSDGLYRARVFPIEPGRDLTIRLSFEQVLPSDQGTAEWRYPLATDRFAGGVPPAVHVTVKVESSRPLGAVYGPMAGLSVTRDGDARATVTYEAPAGRASRDLLLYVGQGGDGTGVTIASGKNVAEDGTFLAVITPRAGPGPEGRLPKDVVFVLDTSGSMQGEKIRQARAALDFGVRSLAPTDRFRVLAFASEVHPFRDDLLLATRENVEAAVAWIDALSAEGGTNIEGALQAALRGLTPDRLPLVVFLTDGAPTVGMSDREGLVALSARLNTAHARLFPFGVGYDLDVRLLDLLAERSRGTRDYVAPQEDIEVVTSRFFRKVNAPVLSDVELDLGAGVRDVYPPSVGDLFAGQQVVVTGRYATPGPRTIRIRGRIGDRAVEERHEVVLKDGPGPDFLARLWAQRKVAYLLDQIRLHGPSAEVVDEVTRLATRHGIVTPYTSGLVVEEGQSGGLGGRRAGRAVAAGPVIRDAAPGDHSETDDDLPTEEAFGEGGLSDAPFEGPSHNGLLGLGGGAGGAFQGRGGHRNLRAGGGGRRHDDTVEDALRWLAAHQAPDGTWSAARFADVCDGRPVATPLADGAGDPQRDVGVTALATLAYLGAGYTMRSEGPFGPVVGRALRAMRNVQDAEGCVGARDSSRFLEDHAWATQALVEAYGMTGSVVLRGPAQKALDFLATARDPSGVWGRTVRDGRADAAVTMAAALAHRAARTILAWERASGRPDSLLVDAAVAPALLAWARGPSTAALEPEEAAARLLVRALDPALSRAEAEVPEAAMRLLASIEDGKAAGGRAGLWYAGATASFQVGREPWKAWQGAMHVLLDAARGDGDFCGGKGSWDPPAATPVSLGRVGVTALLALTLETSNREERGAAGAGRPGASGGSAPPTAPPGARAVDESLDLHRRREGASVAGSEARLVGSQRTVGARTFRLDEKGRWVDGAWDGKAALETIEVGTDAWMALAREGDDVARALALGDRLVIWLGTRAVEVVPPSAPSPRR